MKRRPEQQTKNRRPHGSGRPPWIKWFVWGVLIFGGVLVLWALLLMATRGVDIGRFVDQGWGQYADVIVRNKIKALWHGAFMTFCAGGALWFLATGKGLRSANGRASARPTRYSS